jgi:undecaprenyl-diphosphatase
MERWNLHEFAILNAGAGLSGWCLHLAQFAAADLIYIVPLILIAAWLWGTPRCRTSLVLAVAAAIGALMINGLIGFAWYHPRPFVLGIGHTYLAHAADSSFPSDHAALMWAVGAMLFARTGTRMIGIGIIILTLVTAWTRIYVGVHFPLDMAGAIVVGSLCAFGVALLRTAVECWILPPVETAYRYVFAKPIAYGYVRR